MALPRFFVSSAGWGRGSERGEGFALNVEYLRAIALRRLPAVPASSGRVVCILPRRRRENEGLIVSPSAIGLRTPQKQFNAMWSVSVRDELCLIVGANRLNKCAKLVPHSRFSKE